MRRTIFPDDGAGRYDASIPNSNAPKDDGAASDPRTITDSNRLNASDTSPDIRVGVIVRTRDERNADTDADVLPDRDLRAIVEAAPVVHAGAGRDR
jgi:hypothetical protein